MKIKKKLVASTLGLCLLTGGAGVYAGTVIQLYKTPRGNIATVESVNVHKNRIGIEVNGKSVSQETWYADGVTYAPMRDVAEMLGASVNYDPTTMSADFVTKSELLDLLGLSVNKTYYGNVSTPAYDINPAQFIIKSFNPVNNEFEGELTYSRYVKAGKGTISEKGIVFKSDDATYELSYNGASHKYTGRWFDSIGRGDIYINID